MLNRVCYTESETGEEMDLTCNLSGCQGHISDWSSSWSMWMWYFSIASMYEKHINACVCRAGGWGLTTLPEPGLISALYSSNTIFISPLHSFHHSYYLFFFFYYHFFSIFIYLLRLFSCFSFMPCKNMIGKIQENRHCIGFHSKYTTLSGFRNSDPLIFCMLVLLQPDAKII